MITDAEERTVVKGLSDLIPKVLDLDLQEVGLKVEGLGFGARGFSAEDIEVSGDSAVVHLLVVADCPWVR